MKCKNPTRQPTGAGAVSRCGAAHQRGCKSVITHWPYLVKCRGDCSLPERNLIKERRGKIAPALFIQDGLRSEGWKPASDRLDVAPIGKTLGVAIDGLDLLGVVASHAVDVDGLDVWLILGIKALDLFVSRFALLSVSGTPSTSKAASISLLLYSPGLLDWPV